MKYIIIIILLNYFANSFKEVKPKLCINCKHFITDNNTGKFGKCSLFPLSEGKFNFLVNGINEEEYHYASIARENNLICGEKGNMYKKKIIRNKKLE
jgi:hypothetical protein